MIRETKRIAANNNVILKIGYYKGYHGNELSEAISLFSEKYPAIDVQITVGSHEELYHAMENGTVDLALNDQRRAFSDAYNNIIIAESKIYIEISAKNPLSKLPALEIADLKNTPCILVINQSGQREEQEYYESIIGLHGEFLFADTVQEARLKVVTGRGYMPVDIIGVQPLLLPRRIYATIRQSGSKTCKTQQGGIMTAKRLNYLDMAKGIGIILVVAGHSGLCGDGLLAWLSSFHMPLFFVISGMLLSHRQEEARPLAQSARKKAYSILLPYFTFSLIYLLIELIYRLWKHQELSLSDAVLQSVSFYGISVLWFLPALFAGELLFLFIRKKTGHLLTLISCSVLCFVGVFCRNLYAAYDHPVSGPLFFVWLGYLIPTGIRVAIGLAFLAAGYYFMMLLERLRNRMLPLAAAILFFAVNLCLVHLNGNTDFRSLSLGNPFLYLAGALTGSLAVILLCQSLPKLKLLSYLGGNSLIIMVTHLDCRIMLISHKFAGLIESYLPNRYLFLLNVALSLLLLELVIVYVVNRWFPFLIGRKRGI